MASRSRSSPPRRPPDLALDIDPKLAWAPRHREFFPIDINTASRHAILRIPGVGARNTRRILAARKVRSLRLADLRRLRVALNRARPFLIAADHHPDTTLLDSPRLDAALRPSTVQDSQLCLFAAAVTARTREL